MLDGYGNSGIPLKGQPAGQHLIEHHTRGIDVAAGISTVAPCLFGRDIMDGTQGLLGQRLGGVFQTGDAKVGYFYTAVPQDHNVLGFDVPVDDAPAVGVAQAPHDLGDEVQGFPPVQLAPLFHVLFESNTVDELHDDIFRIAAPGHIVNGYDIGMGQLGDSLGLRVEAAAEILVLGQVGLQNFHGYQAVETVAFCLVDHRHAACADALQDLIAVIQHFSNILIHTSTPFLTGSASGLPSRCQEHPAIWQFPANGQGTHPVLHGAGLRAAFPGL